MAHTMLQTKTSPTTDTRLAVTFPDGSCLFVVFIYGENRIKPVENHRNVHFAQSWTDDLKERFGGETGVKSGDKENVN